MMEMLGERAERPPAPAQKAWDDSDVAGESHHPRVARAPADRRRVAESSDVAAEGPGAEPAAGTAGTSASR